MVRPFFPPAMLDRMRQRDERAMPSACAILHTAPGATNLDGSRDDGTTVTTTVSCRFVDALKAAEVLAAMRVTVEADAILYVPLSATVDVKDVIVYSGDTYQVVGTNQGASYATSLALAIKLVK